MTEATTAIPTEPSLVVEADDEADSKPDYQRQHKQKQNPAGGEPNAANVFEHLHVDLEKLAHVQLKFPDPLIGGHRRLGLTLARLAGMGFSVIGPDATQTQSSVAGFQKRPRFARRTTR